MNYEYFDPSAVNDSPTVDYNYQLDYTEVADSIDTELAN